MTYASIVILTGAGVSAESGLGTFREKDGLWTKYDLNEVATPEGFARNPDLVLSFYSMRRENLKAAKPNKAHEALAHLETQYRERMIGRVTLITQNVDNLHEQAGSSNIIHMHGELAKTLCNNCGNRFEDMTDFSVDRICGSCGTKGLLRPDVVWFGEIPYHMDDIEGAVSDCDLFISIGTSGAVYPAAGLASIAGQVGAHTVELNLEPSDGAYRFQEHHYGPASEVVPRYVAGLLA